MRGISVVLLLLAAICWGLTGERAVPARAAGSASATTAPAAHASDFGHGVRPLLERYCFECHGDGNTAGDLDLGAFRSSADIERDKDTWLKVVRFARGRVMPPPDAEHQPTQGQREQLVSALQRQLYDPSHPDPGRVAPRRLNRTEYRNTIRDLTGVTFDPSADFPQDDTGYGFDNIADVLTLPPLLMERYLAAADKILDEAIPTEPPPSRQRHVPAAEAVPSFKQRDRRGAPDGWVALDSREEDFLSTRVEIPAPADYTIRVLAYAERDTKAAATRPTTAPTRPITLSLMLNDVVARDVEVTADAKRPQWYEARVGATAGRQSFRAAVRRRRGPTEDVTVRGGRVGEEQDGRVLVKEIVIDGPLRGAVQHLSADRLGVSGHASSSSGDVIFLGTSGDEATATIDPPVDGDYLLRVQACAENAGDQPAKMELRVDGRALKTFTVTAPAAYKPSPTDPPLSERARRAVPQVYEVRARLSAGKRRVSAVFLNDAYFPDDPRPNFRDRNLLVRSIEAVELSGDPQALPVAAPLRPLFAKYETPASRLGASAAAGDAARGILREFAMRAWRRPPRAEEVDRLVRLYDVARSGGESFRGGVKHAMKGVLVSPSFLFRGLPPPQQPATEPASPHPIDEFELASRLSYFLWSSTPDDELLELARRGELRRQLDAQLKRMLASPKAQALVENFAGQWLGFRNLDAAHPDDKKFEDYDDRLRDDMKRETQLFFQSIVTDDRSLLDVLTADYTFLNARLAKHYGIKGIDGDNFRRVSLAGTPRRGVVTQGSVLTLTSNPTRTSPVKRGKWVLENLLGTPPPPPPANIPPLEGGPGKQITGTLRQRLEKHRADPMCASCHAPMDPIGFSLENFDAIGRWRERDGGEKIDASSAFPDGTKLSGPVELASLLAKTRRNDFYRSAAEAALTFSLGRGVEPYDQPAIDEIIDGMKQNDGKFSSLIAGVVRSVPFQMRRGETAADATRADATR